MKFRWGDLTPPGVDLKKPSFFTLVGFDGGFADMAPYQRG
jgi:hypothetical protein